LLPSPFLFSSWGTKGDDKSSDPSFSDLGTVQPAGKGAVAVDLPDGPADANASYALALASIRESKHPSIPLPQAVAVNPVAKKKKRTGEESGDYYANFRTNVLLAWVLLNGLLAAAILSGGGADTVHLYAFFVFVFRRSIRVGSVQELILDLCL
jgi:chitin synthase